jgi:hypothetical protein
MVRVFIPAEQNTLSEALPHVRPLARRASPPILRELTVFVLLEAEGFVLADVGSVDDEVAHADVVR